MFTKIRELVIKNTDDFRRYCKQMVLVPLISGCAALIFIIINILTKEYPLTIATAIFAFLSLSSSIITKKNKDYIGISVVLYSLAILILFSYFILSGVANGYSKTWCLILPIAGPFLFGKILGSINSLILFIVLIFCFLSPNNWIFADYDINTSLRFPLTYISFYMIGIYLELLRYKTSIELKKTKDQFENLSIKDSLTGFYNRSAFHKEINDISNLDVRCNSLGIIFLNINGIRDLNRISYSEGDKAIMETSKAIKLTIEDKATIYRTGGDEFIIIAKDMQITEFNELFALLDYTLKDNNLNVACGKSFSMNPKRITTFINDAYEDMLKNKDRIKKRD